MKKLLSLLLVMALCASLLVGCGSTSTEESTSEESTETTTEETAVEETEEAAEADEAEEAEEAEEEADEEAAEETAEEEPAEEETVITIEYPLSTDVEAITYWTSYPGLYSGIAEDWNSTAAFLVMEEQIGVQLVATCVSTTVEQEQYNLMIASGDLTDFLQTSNYTGGLTQAYNDDIILDLTDLVEENAPDYVRITSELDAITQEELTEQGLVLAIYTVYDEYVTTRGMTARADWMEELGIDTPTTLDEFTDMLYAFKNTYDCDYAFRFDEDGGITYLDDAFGTEVVGADASEFPVYLEGDTIVCTYTADEYRDYLEWFVQLYEDGVINQDFYTLDSRDQSSRYTAIIDGEVGVWEENAFSLDDWQSYTDDPDLLKTAAIPNICDDDGVNNWGELAVYVNTGGYSITTSCENPELVLQFFNYFYTDEGLKLANYGVEGLTYTSVEDGEVQWTELVSNNGDFSPDNALYAYSLNKTIVPYYCVQAKTWNCYSDNAVAAAELWSDRSNVTAEHDIPNGASLTADESYDISTISNDIITIADEAILNFMTGATPINDETWATFVSNLESAGLETVVAVYQNAYDEYAAGER